MKQALTKTSRAFGASSTCVEQAQFPGFENTQFPPRAAVVSKRSPGRPKGPRGFVFRVPGHNSRCAFDCAVDLHSRARRNAVSALVARRSRGERDAFGHAEAIHGRQTLHFSFACVLAGFLRLRGGVL
jgi:hypothetical protein